MTKYLVLIAAGNDDYGPKVGWDDLHETRAAAEDEVARAERNDGWSAKVVEVEDD